MQQADFAAALTSALRWRGLPIDRGAVAAFAASVFPLVEDDADVERWADEFVAGQAGQLVADVAAGMGLPE